MLIMLNKIRAISGLDTVRANSFRFFSVKVSLKLASLEEKNHREVE
jgi:hypothetical protein